MKVYENQQMTNWTINQIQKKMDDGRKNDDALHASEIYGCFRKTVLNRNHEISYDPETIMMFAVGFAMQEWFLGHEPESKEVFGVLFSADQVVGENIIEFKTTRKSVEKYAKDDKGKPDKTVPKVAFHPTEMDHWINRTRAYCAAHDINTAHILVFFLYQNTMKAWTFEFSDQELGVVKKDIVVRKNELEPMVAAYKKSKIVPSISTRNNDWECEYCPFLMAVDGWKGCLKELQDDGVKISPRKKD